MPSQTFGNKKPYKSHLNRGTGGVQAEISKLRSEIDQAFLSLEADGHLSKYNTATSDPTVNNDASEGYSVLSRWANITGNREYVCLSAAEGAAVWVETTAAGGGGSTDQVTNDSNVVGATATEAFDALLASVDEALFDLGTASILVRHIYIDMVAGNDANDGLTSLTPILTKTRLYELLPLVIDQPTLVHMTDGTLVLGTDPIPYTIGTRLLMFMADEAWDPRGTLYSIQTGVSGVAAASTNAFGVVAPMALVANAHRCMSIRFTSGAAVGQRRTISTNTTTTFSPSRSFSPAPAPGDTYEVFTNNTVIQCNGFSSFTGSGISADPGAGFVFMGIDFDGAGSTTNATVGANFHQFYGCRVRSFFFGIGPSFTGGYVSAGENHGTVLSQFGINDAILSGWGLATENTTSGVSTGTRGTLSGHFVCKGQVVAAGHGAFTMSGGFIFAFTSAGFAQATFSGISASLRTLIGDAADTGSKVSLSLGSPTVNLTSNTTIQNNSATNPAISVERGGVMNISATINGSNANATGLSVRCRRGGQIYLTGQPVFGKVTPAAADWRCEAAADQLATFFSAADVRLADAAAPESIIRRIS